MSWGRWRSCIGLVRRFRAYAGVIIIVGISIILAVETTYFLDPQNLLKLLHHGAVLGFLALGLTYVAITGEFDISFANLSGFVGVLVAISLVHLKQGTFISILIGLLVALAIGAFNGFLVGYRGYISIAVTIATANLVMGLNYLSSGARPIYGKMPDGFIFIGHGHIGIFPFSVLLLALFYIVSYFILNKFKFGYYLYAVGANPEGAKAVGISPEFLKFLTFLISGICAAVGGFLITSWVKSGQPNIGPPYLFEAFGAVFFGKAISRHYQITLLGTLQGVLLLSIVFNGVTLLGIPHYLYRIILGITLLLALFIYRRE
jgi:ribose transport system permease protein